MKSKIKYDRIKGEILELYIRLRERFPKLEMQREFSFARHTTIGCGGTASVAAFPSEEECAELLSYLSRYGIPFCFLGAGANVLPSDERFEGVVVRFSRMRRIVTDGGFLYAGAGVTGGTLCRFARERSLGGFEPLTGIPTTAGGALVMNAGVPDGHISDLVVRVYGIETGKAKVFETKDCLFAQKSSIFQSGIAITGAVFRAEKIARSEIDRRTAYFRSRRAHLPKGRSMGCVFVNPEGISAGRLIDECGLKGFSVGGARVSEEHANFILNEGGTAQDIARLIEVVKERVREKTGIALREEIRRIP